MNLHKPVAIGPVTIPSNVVLAPMSGVTDMPFRRLVKQCGAGLVVSEMIASRAMIHAAKRTMKMSSHCAEEHPMAVQLAGFEPEVIAEAAKLNEDRGAAIIDINMGCPAKKVTNGCAGSALMRDLSRAGKILAAAVKAVSIPVTLKMRTGWDDASRNAPELARIAEDCGVQSLAVHGRTRCQFYKGASDWAFIGEVKRAVSSVPVFGNGDVVTADGAKALMEASGADGVLVGRGAYGRPWFLNQVIRFLKTGERLPDPPLHERCALVLDHYEDMIAHYGPALGVKIARKHLGWYSKGLPNAAAFRARVNRMDNPVEVKALIREAHEPRPPEQAAA